MKAQDIVDMILGSERYGQSKAFSDRVYRDEPILRTGADAFNEGARRARERYASREGKAAAQADRDDTRARQAGTRQKSGRGALDTGSHRVDIHTARQYIPPATERYDTVDWLGKRMATQTNATDSNKSDARPFGDSGIFVTQPVSDADGRASRQRVEMSAKYKQMRAMQRSVHTWERQYITGGAKLFYEQGKFMEDYEDDFEGTADLVMYYPTYAEMSDYELRCYFSWRTKVRKGLKPAGPTSFKFVLAYEILCGIGVTPGEEGFAALQRLRADYAGTSTAFDSHLARWVHDYVVDHGLDKSLLVAQGGSFNVGAVSVLRRAEKTLLTQKKPDVWPDRLPEGWVTPEELMDALAALSRYRADRSRFFKDHREDVAYVCARVFAKMVAHCHKRRKTDYVDGLFGEPTRISYTLYPSAVYWMTKPHEDVRYEASGQETYECERGFWWRVLPCRKTDTNRELGTLMHAIDARMRLAMGDAHPLKERSGLPKYQAKFVDETISELLGLRAAEEAARISIDLSALGHIRSASVRTREALLTDEERGEDVGAVVRETPADDKPVERIDYAVVAETDVRTQGDAPMAGTSVSEPVGATGASIATGSSDTALGLTEEQVGLLEALLAGGPVPASLAGGFVSLAVDAINEVFLDVVGDTVLEYDGDEPTLVADYVDDVRDALGM